jgi:hypothetical protein
MSVQTPSRIRPIEEPQLRHPRRWFAVLPALFALALPAAAHAGIWTELPTPTQATITAIDYQGGDNFWFTTSGAIYKRNGGGWTLQKNAPGANFTDIAFNPSGTTGLAVGQAGIAYRFTGGQWTQVTNLLTYHTPDGWCGYNNAGGYARDLPISEDLTRVRWIDDSTVFVFSKRNGSLLESTNGGAGWQELNRQPNGSCRLDASVSDVAVLPGQTNYMLLLSRFCTQVFLTSNGLASAPALRGGAGCWSDDAMLWLDPVNTTRIFTSGAGGATVAFSGDGGVHFAGARVMNGAEQPSLAFDHLGETSLGAGVAGYIYNGITPDQMYREPAGGALETNEWDAVDLASASTGAVGGVGGKLIVSSQLNTVADIVKPTGSIVAAPATATAPTTVTFTANVADDASGVNTAGIQWKLDGQPAGTGPSVAIPFATGGYHTLDISFADNAGNTATASLSYNVDYPPPDEEEPTIAIAGPDVAVVGTTATYTATVADTGGSGIKASSLRWTRNGKIVGTGMSAAIVFPEQGDNQVQVSVADNAGNDASATRTVGVAPKPGDRPVAQPVPAPPPTIKRQGGYYVIPVKGGYGLPPKVSAAIGCRGDVIVTIKKAKKLLTARTTTLNKQCKYTKQVSIAKGKVGSAKALKFTIRFGGNPFLAPVKKTYTVKVPR